MEEKSINENKEDEWIANWLAASNDIRWMIQILKEKQSFGLLTFDPESSKVRVSDIPSFRDSITRIEVNTMIELANTENAIKTGLKKCFQNVLDYTVYNGEAYDLPTEYYLPQVAPPLEKSTHDPFTWKQLGDSLFYCFVLDELYKDIVSIIHDQSQTSFVSVRIKKLMEREKQHVFNASDCYISTPKDSVLIQIDE